MLADGVCQPNYRWILNNFGKLPSLRTFPHEHARPRHAACASLAGSPAMSHFGTKGAGDLNEKRSRPACAASGWSRGGTVLPRRQTESCQASSCQGGFRRTSYCYGRAGTSDAGTSPCRTPTSFGRLSVARPVAERARWCFIQVALITDLGYLGVLSNSTCRLAPRMPMIKPARTSTRPMTTRRKNVEVPALLTNRNSTSMATNSSIART